MQIRLLIAITRSPRTVYRLVLFDSDITTLIILLFWVFFNLMLDRYT
jgi:hypothetical protein